MQSPPNLKTLISDDKDSLILLLWNQNQQLMKQVARLEEEIKVLKSQLSQNSRNSSRPPSSDGYGKPKPKNQRKKSKRSSDRQPEHKGQTLKQVEHSDQTEHHEVSHCSQYGEDLSTHSASEKEVEQAKEKGLTSLQKKRVLYFDRRYNRLLRDKRDELPMLPTASTNKPDRTKQHKVKNLHDRLRNNKK